MSNKNDYYLKEEEDVDDNLVTSENELDDEEVLDLSVKSRVFNQDLSLSNGNNKRKNKPIKSIVSMLAEEQQIEHENDTETDNHTDNQINEDLIDSSEFENTDFNNTSLNEDDYLSANQDYNNNNNNNNNNDLNPQNQSELSINDSNEILNDDDDNINVDNESGISNLAYNNYKKQDKIKKPKTIQINNTKFKTVNNLKTQNSPHSQSISATSSSTTTTTTSKKQMRFQCRFCVYKSHSVSLMQNHIYRHIDTTPYSCYYCGHKSTTKSTIMVHIELCHPNMEVKIKESRVKEEDYYLDLNSNSSSCSSTSSSSSSSTNNHDKFESNQKNSINNSIHKTPPTKRKKQDIEEEEKLNNNNNSQINSVLSFKSSNSTSPSLSSSSESSLCSSPSQSPNPHKIQTDQLQIIKSTVNDDDLLLQKNKNIINDTNNNENLDEGSYTTVFNRPKQYFGSLYEPDKQYSCKLCTYTTNHKPSMEDHVYVHTNKRPYRCGYCNEEIYTRYAATYHNKYKHPGEPRNFIKDEQDVSIYYVNRAKKNSSSSCSSGSSFSCIQSNNSINNEDENNTVKSFMNTTNNNNSNNNINNINNKTVENINDTIKLKKFKKNTENVSINEIKPLNQSSSLNKQSISPNTDYLNNLPLNLNNNNNNNNINNNNNNTNLSNTPINGGYDFNLALKMYQIQLQSIMAANYLQNIRTNTISNQTQTSVNPPNNLFASYFGLNQDQLQQLSNYLNIKTKFDTINNEDSLTQNEHEDSSLNNSENSDGIDLKESNKEKSINKNNKLIKNK